MSYLSPISTLYFEDFAIGQCFSTESHTIDAEQIMAFARQFDPQPFHLDAETAKDTYFQGLIASGWHTGSITMRLLVESLPIAGGVIGAGGALRWPKPTHPGDTLRAEGEVVDLQPSNTKADRGIVTLHLKTLNQNNECVQDMTANLVVFRRPI